MSDERLVATVAAACPIRYGQSLMSWALNVLVATAMREHRFSVAQVAYLTGLGVDGVRARLEGRVPWGWREVAKVLPEVRLVGC